MFSGGAISICQSIMRKPIGTLPTAEDNEREIHAENGAQLDRPIQSEPCGSLSARCHASTIWIATNVWSSTARPGCAPGSQKHHVILISEGIS
ncbi:hypothetical protein ACLOJK_032102 [Asimina triloba]